MASVRFVAIGDSFTEGVGDELPDGRVRGWADLVAQGWAAASDDPVEYANLAIRGKLIAPIIEQQLEPALALKPTHLSFNGGGNDILRPRTSISHVTDLFMHVVDRCRAEGVTLIALSGANPTAQLPLRPVIQKRGDLLSQAVSARLRDHPEVVTAWNWPDRELATSGYWSDDRLHMNARGHHRVAARVLTSLGVPVPAGGRFRSCRIFVERAVSATTPNTSVRGSSVASPAPHRATAASRSTTRGPPSHRPVTSATPCSAVRRMGRAARRRRARGGRRRSCAASAACLQ
jgi:lysophospholipase L1-like esterase